MRIIACVSVAHLQMNISALKQQLGLPSTTKAQHSELSRARIDALRSEQQRLGTDREARMNRLMPMLVVSTIRMAFPPPPWQSTLHAAFVSGGVGFGKEAVEHD